ncbi:MAG TPA: hypothetical protein VMR21_12265 [Vicinamibacteria bacterium]|nr:hypothetical protein [Vicinamibacteria bacterium]
MTRPRTTARSGRAPLRRFLLLTAALGAGACAAPLALPPAPVLERARLAPSYSALLHVSLRGPSLRARTRVVLAFRRPDALRIEVPGPAGARLVAVASGGRLWAVFPSERAVFSGAARAEDLESLLGIALEPGEVMDLLVGTPSPRVPEYRVKWGAALPREIRAVLPDGARLTVKVEEAEAPAPLGAAAFAEPPHEGFRAIGAEEARSLWSVR